MSYRPQPSDYGGECDRANKKSVGARFPRASGTGRLLPHFVLSPLKNSYQMPSIRGLSGGRHGKSKTGMRGPRIFGSAQGLREYLKTLSIIRIYRTLTEATDRRTTTKY